MKQKFRPALTAEQIAYLIDLLENDNRSETEAMRDSLLGYLMVFRVKAKSGIVSAAYSAKPKVSIADQLGAADPIQKRELAYQKYTLNPELCSQEEISLAKTYMFEHDLLTEDEEGEL